MKNGSHQKFLRLAVIASIAATACRGEPQPPPPEFTAAMAAYELALDADPFDQSHPKYDVALTALRAVPPGGEFEDIARETIERIVTQRSEQKAERKERDLRIRAAVRALVDSPPVRQTSRRSARPASRSRPVRIAPSRSSKPGVKYMWESDFDRAAENARAKRLAREAARRQAQEEARRRAETERRMKERLNEKLDRAEWDCNMITGQCEKEASVTEDEIR